MNHFLSIESLDEATILALLSDAARLKVARQARDRSFQPLAGQAWGLIFTKSSTRTRVSFEVGIRELGGHAMFFSGHDLQLGRGEPIRDTARVLGRMIDGAVIRNDSQRDLEDFAHWSEIPTVNALTDLEHPCQILADLLTVRERLGTRWRDARICFLGDGACNVARSWVWAAARLGFDLVLAAPDGFRPEPELLAAAGHQVTVVTDPREAVAGCDVLYTDVWVSMGREEEGAHRLVALRPYQVNAQLVAATGRDSLVLHCLPAYREKEITDEVLEAHASEIFDQAENRLHVQKAILAALAEASFHPRSAD